MSRQATYAKTPAKGKGAIPKKKPAASAPAKKDDKPKRDELPAFGLPMAPQKKQDIDFEALKKKNIRRISPAGEDKKGMANVIKSIKDKNVTVEEFITLIAPFTGDNGACLRTVVSDDMEVFRNLARKIYETMAQDISDVLVNEHLQLTQYYEERLAHYNDRMIYFINEIHNIIPDFNFEKFIKDSQQYLLEVIPIPEIMIRDAEDVDLEKRQMAYHRLLWLRTEGSRLAEENERLMRRLADLKKQQAEAQRRAEQIAESMESERQQLEAQEQDMKQQLEELNKSMDKSFLQSEARETQETLKKSMAKTPAAQGPTPSTGAVRKQPLKRAVKARKPRPDWVQVEAAKMETEGVQEALEAEKFNVTAAPSTKRPARRRGDFHFSPVKTPPQKQAQPRVVSPFHYSPPKSPPPEPARQVEERKVVTVQNRELPPPRRSGQPPGGYSGGFW